MLRFLSNDLIKEIPRRPGNLEVRRFCRRARSAPVSIVDGVDNAFHSTGKEAGTEEIFQKIQRSFTYSIDQNTSRSGVDLDGADTGHGTDFLFHEFGQPCIAEKGRSPVTATARECGNAGKARHIGLLFSLD